MWRLLFLVLVQHLVAVHCKGPDPVPSPSPLALLMPTPRFEAPAVLWLPDSPPEGPVRTEATGLGLPAGGGDQHLIVSSCQEQTALRLGTRV